MPAVTERSVPLTGHDQYLFREGTHSRLYEKLGAHFLEAGTDSATHFAVWAPNAQSVSVIGDWNGWAPRASPMRSAARAASGLCKCRRRSPAACTNFISFLVT